jgi:hypothetical protein
MGIILSPASGEASIVFLKKIFLLMINPGGKGTMGVSFLKSKNWLHDCER